MIKWGVAAGTHDGSLAVVKDNDILFASHSERYSRVKNDAHLDQEMIDEALSFGMPDKIYWYEDPYKKALRKLYAGQKNIWLSPKKYLKQWGLQHVSLQYGNHHESHAAAGFATSNFNDAAVLVIDAIGEFTTTSISVYENTGRDCYRSHGVFARSYPWSLGLFYSAITDRVGLKPNEDEYILMGMSAYGDPDRYYHQMRKFVWGKNLHRGCREFLRFETINEFDMAAAAQKIYEEEFIKLLKLTAELTGQKNLVLMGGCALNCLANRHIEDYFENVWIMPNPGDAGSSIGAIAAGTKQKLNWQTPYLGYNIEGKYPVKKALDELLENKIVGVASGRAEFGPRALGNRSLLADPTGQEMKDVVNKIKKRQEFRPFAPVILEEDVHKYFNVDRGFTSPYMQYIVTVKEPTKYPAIVHRDGSSRVQTVNKIQHKGLWRLLNQYKKHTGTPMLLNTSLNIKGEPMVNSRLDADKFSKKYSVKVVS
jgi:carbamoyltransferase